MKGFQFDSYTFVLIKKILCLYYCRNGSSVENEEKTYVNEQKVQGQHIFSILSEIKGIKFVCVLVC
jgi:hypothetical protein